MTILVSAPVPKDIIREIAPAAAVIPVVKRGHKRISEASRIVW